MAKETTETSLNPPGIMPTIATSFELVSRHLWLLILPITLDLSLWMGTRLGAQVFLEEMIAFWQQDDSVLAVAEEVIEQFTLLVTRTNLFASLSVPIIGIPTLMTGITPESTPLPTETIELGSMTDVALAIIGLTVVGLLLTAVYYTLIAYTIRSHTENPLPTHNLMEQMGVNWLKLLAFTLIILLFLFILYIPLLLIATLFSFISPVLSAMVAVMAPFLLLSLLFQLIFAPYSIILHGRPLINAVMESSAVFRTNVMNSITFIFTIAFISYLMNIILTAIDDGGWMMTVGIVAHAYIGTALVTAVFIFYHDRAVLLAPQE